MLAKNGFLSPKLLEMPQKTNFWG